MSSSLPLETFCFKGTEWSWTAGRGETGRGDSESDSVEEGLRARTEVCDQENHEAGAALVEEGDQETRLMEARF